MQRSFLNKQYLNVKVYEPLKKSLKKKFKHQKTPKNISSLQSKTNYSHVMWIHKGYFVVKICYEIFVLKLSVIQ